MSTDDPDFRDPQYLGDGVYVGHDGYSFWLHANDHKNPTDRIALEPVVFHAFVRYVTRIMRERHPTDEETPHDPIPQEQR